MPTYEYACDACGTAFERFQRMSEEPIRRCPQCRKLKVRRLIGAGGGLIFRGSGFYATDYRSTEYKAQAKAESSPTPAAAKTDSAAKPAATKEAGRKDGATATK